MYIHVTHASTSYKPAIPVIPSIANTSAACMHSNLYQQRIRGPEAGATQQGRIINLTLFVAFTLTRVVWSLVEPL